MKALKHPVVRDAETRRTLAETRPAHGTADATSAPAAPKRRGRPPKNKPVEQAQTKVPARPNHPLDFAGNHDADGICDTRRPDQIPPQEDPDPYPRGFPPDPEAPGAVPKDTAFLRHMLGSGDAVTIRAPRFQTAVVEIVGTAPLVLHKFSQKVQSKIRETQEAGQQAKKGRTREKRDFEESYHGARHISVDGWDGIPASAFRCALISACRTVNFKMTLAKLSLFIKADGYDEEGTPLVRITEGSPRMDVRPGRNANGSIDLRARPMWLAGWKACPILSWDADQFSANDVVNLLSRAGMQVGVGEGRPDSKMSAGCGWGQFEVVA